MKDINQIVWDAIHTGKNAEPWVVDGVEGVGAGATVTNPTPVNANIIGQVISLPYVVPQNRILVIKSMHIGTDPSGATQCHLKIKLTSPNFSAVTAYDLIKYNEHNEHHMDNGMWLPERTSIRVDLINTTAFGAYIRYWIEGILVDYTEALRKK